MLHPVIENLKILRLFGMVKALQNQTQLDDISFEERLGLLLDQEILDRNNRRLQARLRQAALKQSASMEDIEYGKGRGLDKMLLASLANCQWVKEHRNILITGPTGTGKTYLACALAHKACLEGYNVNYQRITRLLPNLSIARGDGSYSKEMKNLAKTEVLILDDWGLTDFTTEHRRDLLELLDDRHEKRSTIVTSQLPIKLWHDAINDKTLADAILDRLIHNAYRLELVGESMRKIRANVNK